MSSIIVVILLLGLSSKLSTSTCFLPNGSAHNDPGTQPCSFDQSNPIHATCCHSRWENTPGSDIKYGPTADECLSNGLCQNRGYSSIPGDEHPPWTHYYRVYCTNEDWDGCLSVCDTGLNANDVVQLTPCDGTTTSEQWCCGDTTNCCTPEGSHHAVTIARELGNSILPPSPPKLQHEGLSKSAKIGLGLSIPIGVLSLFGNVLVLILWFLNHRNAVSSDMASTTCDTNTEETKEGVTGMEELEAPTAELYADILNAELA